MALQIRACAVLFFAAAALLAHDPHDPIQVVAISPNFAHDQTLLAASTGMTVKLGSILLFKSTDGGANWSPLPGLPGNSNIYSVAFSPAYAKDKTVLVAGDAGLYRSTDNATTWATLSTESFIDMALSPNFAKDNTLYVLTNNRKIFRSTNRGQKLGSISAPASLTGALSTLAVSPNLATDHTLLLGTQKNGIFKSTNGGGSWTPVTTGTVPKIEALEYSPSFSSDQTVFAATLGSGFLISTNAGSWTQSSSGLTDMSVISMAFSPAYAQDATLWVTTAAGGAFQSANRGASWGRPVTIPRTLSPLTTIHYQTIAAAPGLQLLGTFEGLWTSANSGASWDYIDLNPTRMVRYILPSPDYANDQTVFVTTYGSGSLWTTDGGANWSLENTGMTSPYIDGAAISPNFANDGMAFGGTYKGLDRTKNRGVSWELMPGPGTIAYPRGLALSPNFAQDGIVYLGTTAPNSGGIAQIGKTPAGFYTSTDQGKTWTLTGLNGTGVISIAISPAFTTDNTVFVATESNGVYKSTDSASTWTQLKVGTTQMVQVVLSPGFATDGTVFTTAVPGGLYKSSNGGSSWTLLPNTGNMRVLDIALSPNFANDQTMFIGTIQNGVMMSTNGGAAFSTVTSFPDVFAGAVGISPNFANDHTLLAAGYPGLFKSTDGGSAWSYLATPARIEESRCVTSPLQEPPTIVYEGAWNLVTQALASSDQYYITPEDQDTAVLSFNGSGVRWVSWTGPAQGTPSIALDGLTLGNVSLTAATNQFQQVVWEQHGLACGDHSFVITASPEVTQSVSLDAFDVWVDGCPFNSSNGASLGSTSMNAGSAAGNGSVQLTIPGSWTAASDAPWISLSPASASGSGNAAIQFTYDANAGASSRIGSITIAGLTFIVTQAGI